MRRMGYISSKYLGTLTFYDSVNFAISVYYLYLVQITWGSVVLEKSVIAKETPEKPQFA